MRDQTNKNLEMMGNDTVPPPPARFHFGTFLLDLERGSLLRDGNEISLRPKTFAVLRFLVANHGRLVSKDELFDAVWPNIAVTDDTLVQSVGELRRALGSDGAGLIKTVPRRGYRFDAEIEPLANVSVHTAADPPVSGVPVSSLALDKRPKTSSRIPWLPSIVVASLAAAGALLYLLFWAAPSPGWRGAHPLDKSETAGPQSAAKPVIAILPFVNETPVSGQDYFTDGLTGDLINSLGRFSELTVMSWNAVLPFKGKAPSPEEVSRHLAARYEVEGSVRRTGDRIRVAAQLADRDGRVLWSDQFDEAFSDLFNLQDKITTEIARALSTRVTQLEEYRALAKPTENLDAYDYVLRARPAIQRPARAGLAQSRAFLRRAIELDPHYAAVYSALAESFYVAVSMGWAETATEYLGQAEQLADKALTIDTRDVRARIVLGRIDIFYHRYEQALAEMERAIAVNPNDAHALAGRGNALMWLGRPEAAIEALQQALRIDPDLHPMDRFALGLAYYLTGRYDLAIEQAERTLRETPGANFSRVLLAAAYAEDNRTDGAARTADDIRRFDPTFDPQEFGTKFLNPGDLEKLRDGLRKAGLYSAEPGLTPKP